MARLPQPGSDQGIWGEILNEYLSIAHSSDGTIKLNSISEARLDSGVRSKLNATTTVADESITSVKLANLAVTDAKLASGIAQSKIANLTADLAAKASDGSVIHISGDETVGGIKTYASSPIVPTPSAGPQAANKDYVDAAVAGSGTGGSGTPTLGGDLTGTTANAQIAAGVVGTTEIANLAVTDAKIATGIAQSKITNLTTDLAAKASSTHSHTLDNLSDVTTAGVSDGQTLVYQAGGWSVATINAGGVTDHGALTGLLDDDHTQYLNDARGDARYFTQSQVNASLAGKANTATQISTGGSLVGGGDLSTTRTLSLSGDVATPGNSKYYGTDGTGVKGYFTLPAGGGGGANSFTVVSKTAAYTATNHDYIISNASTGGFDITLPAVASGATVSVKKVDSSVNAILVKTQGGVLIDDQVSISVNQQWMSYDFLSDGVQWYRV